MIIHNPILTGSFTVNGTDVASITSSAASITAINAYTASQNILNGTYATTGSNTFAGIQTVNSNLVVTGSITAQTLVVQTVTSSVVYSSGSNVFGNNIANTQVMTGSLLLTGSATFNGALSGTSATFSSTITAAALSRIGDLFIGGRSGTYASYPDGIFGDNLHLGATGTSGSVYINTLLSRNTYINPVGGNVAIGNSSPSYSLDVTGTGRFTSTLLVSGAATFGSTITMNGTNAQLLQTTSNSIAGDNVAVLYNSNANSYGMYIGAGSGTNHSLYCTDYTRTKDLFRVLGNGNVGMGLSIPSSSINPTSNPVLAIKSATAGAFPSFVTQYLNGSEGGMTLANSLYIDCGGNSTASSNAIIFRTTNVNSSYSVGEAMRISSAGYLGIGVSSPSTLLDVRSETTGFCAFFRNNATNGNGLAIFNTAGESRLYATFAGTGIDSALTFWTTESDGNQAERMRITAVGNVFINSNIGTTQGEKLFVTSNNLAAMFKTTGGATNQWAANFWNNATTGNNLFIEFATETSFLGRGSVSYNRGAGVTVFNTTSDYRLKSEISDFNALEIISNLKPKKFRIGDAVDKSLGFIAHELQEYLPQAVTGEKDEIDSKGNPRYQGIDYSQLTGLLVKAIQELQAQITELKNK